MSLKRTPTVGLAPMASMSILSRLQVLAKKMRDTQGGCDYASADSNAETVLSTLCEYATELEAIVEESTPVAVPVPPDEPHLAVLQTPLHLYTWHEPLIIDAKREVIGEGRSIPLAEEIVRRCNHFEPLRASLEEVLPHAACVIQGTTVRTPILTRARAVLAVVGK